MSRPQDALDPGVIEQASHWMARLWSGDASESDRAACADWRAAHPDHERAWSRLQAVEKEFGAVPRVAARRVLLEQPPVSKSRRNVLRFVGATFVLGGAAYGISRSEPWARARADYATRTGEIREIMLTDGTRVVLDTQSAMDTRFTTQERRLVLQSGRLFAATTVDPGQVPRAFRVESVAGSIRALGTQFSVRQVDDVAHVEVYEGTLDLRPSRVQREVRRLEAGQRSWFSSTEVGPVERAQDTGSAWIRGHLVAEQMRVADFVAELARYRPGFIQCDASVADLRVTGVFPLRDTDRALQNLMLGVPVEVFYRTRYWVSVRAKA